MADEKLYELEQPQDFTLLRLTSTDGTNRLTRNRVLALTSSIEELAQTSKPLIIAGNEKFFSAGADLNEISQLSGADAFSFAGMGQKLMNAIDHFPAPVIAAIEGYCMGGGLDLALACDLRIAAPNALFGHRGAALGIITGWGGTQRLPRLIGRAQAVQMFLAAEKLTVPRALELDLIQHLSADPVTFGIELLTNQHSSASIRC